MANEKCKQYTLRTAYGQLCTWLKANGQAPMKLCAPENKVSSHCSHCLPHITQQHLQAPHEYQLDEQIPHQPTHSAQRCGWFGRLAEQSPLTLPETQSLRPAVLKPQRNGTRCTTAVSPAGVRCCSCGRRDTGLPRQGHGQRRGPDASATGRDEA